MSRLWLLPAILAVSVCGALCQATPPASKDDAGPEAFIFDRLEDHIRFDDDGTGLRDNTAVVRIQSEAGVRAFGQLVFGYSSATEKLEIQYVRVRKPDGSIVETKTADAQDFAPDVLKEAPMYSDYRERHVSVSNLRPGDVLEYRTTIHVTPLAPNQFWYEHSFPKDAVIEEERLAIDLPKARLIKLKSSKENYSTQDNGDRRTYTWEIKNFKPERETNPEEFHEEDLHPDVQISSFADWQQVAQWYNQLQTDRANPDDAIRKKAEELTRGATTPDQKTQRLYDYVAQNIRYVSLSFGIGRLQPHQASEVLQSGYGDCKDKHTLLQALLRAQGIQSYPVLINSFRELDPDVPSPGQFDHVITAVSLGPQFTWLDSTAEVAPYGLILYPLRDKQALLASADAKGGLVRTPLEAPVLNTLNVKLDGSFTASGSLEVKIDLTATGDSDVPIRIAFRQTPQTNWKQLTQLVSRSWGLAGETSDVEVDSLQDTSKPFHLTYRLRANTFFVVPSSSTDFRLLPPLMLLKARDTDSKNPQAPVNVGPAVERTYRAHIVFPANYTVHLPSAVKMERDYGTYSCAYSLNKNVLDAERRLILKVSQLPASRRFDYESFRNGAGNETGQLLSASIAAPAGAGSHETAPSADTSPAELQKLAVAALQRRDYAFAVDLLKRAVSADADRKDAWDELGQAYAGLNQHDDAVAAFRRQIDLDHNHKSANEELAEELQKEGKFEDAVAAYQKQVEISPYDKRAHKGLGLLYVQMKRDTEARSELEAAAAIPPDDPELTSALAQVYTRTGSPDKAASLMSTLTGASTPSSADVFAGALRDDLNPDQTIREARQTLDQIGDQFDSGEYDRLTPSAFSAMSLVALAWSRIGWAKFLQGETLDAIQFLNSAWLLSQSGVVADRLGRVYEEEGQKEKARHFYALAAATGGPEAQSAREQTTRLAAGPNAATQEITKASAELSEMRTVKMPASAGASGSAQFALVFETSSKPSRAEFLQGDGTLRAAADKIREKEFLVRFPEVSSIKIVRRAQVSCAQTGCSVVLQPVENLEGSSTPQTAKASASP